MNIRKITRQGIVAAIYVVLTIILAPFGYGPIQFRISEILAILPFFNAEYVIGVSLGCFIANMYSSVGVIDMFVGTFHTFITGYIMTKVRNFYIACLVPVLGMFIIAFEIYFMMPNPTGFFVILAELMSSEFAVLYIIGVPIFYVLSKNEKITKILEFKRKLK